MNERCSAHLARFPHNAGLLSFDPAFSSFERLLRAATSIRGVGNAVATKILHRKRRNFIPMLDSVIVTHYASPDETDKIRRALVAIGRFREDLRQVSKLSSNFKSQSEVSASATKRSESLRSSFGLSLQIYTRPITNKEK